ncbi:hypothetical protein LTR85_008386 [Meristemomyces frigidus]|nr:hypothetical protein LTR85_008386 [Meristemomyces frigidus]
MRQRYTEYLEAQNIFRHGDDLAMLTSIMSHLRSVDRIEVGEPNESESEQDVSFYGMRVLEEQTGMEYLPICSPDTSRGIQEGVRADGLQHNFKIVLRALALLRRPINELLVFRVHNNRGDRDDSAGLDVARMPAIRGYLAEGLSSAFQGLRRLDMLLNHWHAGEEAEYEVSWKQWLPEFLALMPSLLHLALMFDGPYSDSYPSHNLQAFESFAQRATVPHLTTLEFGNCCVTAPSIRRLLDQHSETLTNVGLNRILLTSGDWSRSVFAALSPKVGTKWEFKVAWLMEFEEDLESQRVVVFVRKGLEECKQCSPSVQHLKMDADEHLSKMLTAREAQGLANFDYIPVRDLLARSAT